MFAYCNNNPVIYVDYTGEVISWFIAAGVGIGLFIGSLFIPSCDEINDMAEEHYSRNDLNANIPDIDTILDSYEKQSEAADQYHEYTHGAQGEEGIYNDKYLSPDGGHYEVIICSPPGKEPYIVDQNVDPLNMGTYNYASNTLWTPLYGITHFFCDMIPYYVFGNTREDGGGILKWALD